MRYSLSGDTCRFRPAFWSLFFFLVVCCVVQSVGAATPCGITKNDCPACPAGGLSLTGSSSFDNNPTGSYDDTNPFAGLTCNYGNPLSGNTVTVEVECYQDVSVAQKWYQYYKREIPYPYPESQYAPANPKTSYWESPVSHRHSAIRGSDPKNVPTFKSAYADWDFAIAGRNVAKITSVTPTDTITQSQATADNIKRIAQFASCFASFRPGSVPVPAQQTLKGTIYATSYPSGIPRPLKYGQVTLLEEGKKVLGVETNAEGTYEFAYAFQKGKTYQLGIGLAYTRGDKEYFTLYYGEPVESKKVIFRHDFTYTGDADLKQDVNLDDLWKKKSAAVNPFGIMYIHFTEAYEFYADYLKEDVRLNLPLKIVAFSTDPQIKQDRARYDSDGTESFIYISPKESIPESELRPASREYHEFSHYMMANTWGREPEPLVTGHGETINHAGFLNPGTTDSWAEGTAHFMAGAIAERTEIAATAQGEPIEPCDGASYYGVLEDNYKPWEYNGQVEEAAVAGTLWDLYDSADQKRACEARKIAFFNTMVASPYVPASKKTNLPGYIQAIRMLEQRYGYEDDSGSGYEDKASFTLPQLWAVMRTYHPDMLSFYEGLTKKYPGNKQQIDDIFLMHGFWKETSPGNGKHDAEEPYRDANGNKVYDQGEYYIDLADNLAYTTGETIGTAADASRTWRRTTLQVPGQFIQVTTTAPYYSYTVEYPGSKRWPHTNYAVNTNGLIYVPVPPDPAAQITVKAWGVTTGSPLVFTSQQFNDNYVNSLKQGYYVSHDFKLSGPVPPQPEIPDMGAISGGSTSGLTSQSTKAAGSGDIGSVLLLCVSVAGTLVLAFNLKKKRE